VALAASASLSGCAPLLQRLGLMEAPAPALPAT
jgi:hypothetical protein